MILKYFVKNIVMSRRIWIFGILFGLFLLYVGYSQPLTGIGTRLDMILYAANWMAIIILFMLGTVSTTVAQSGIYSSGALPYLFKFSRYTRKSYLYNISLSSILVSLALSSLLMLIAMALFSEKFDFFIYASNFATTYLALLLGAGFMIFFAIFLVLISINYIGTKSINYIHLVPLMLTYGFGIIVLTTHLPNVYFFYTVPFTAFLGLFYSYFSGATNIHLYGGPILNNDLMLICIVTWMAVMIVLDFALLRKLKVSSLEEVVEI